jgi:hypothetical protein
VADVAPAIHEHADLATDLTADLRELASELVREEAVGGQAALVEPLDGANLAGLQAVGVAKDLDTSLRSRRGMAGS